MFTDRGWAALGASLALIILWIAFGEPELLALGIASLVAIFFALWYVRRYSVPLSVVRRLSPALVHEGDEARVGAAIYNPGRRPARGLTIEDTVSALGTATFAASKIDKGASATASYQILCRPRGIYEVGPVQAVVSDPLQLAEMRRLAGEADRLIVYPAIEELEGLPLGRGLDPTVHAARPEFRNRGGEDFFTLREYEVGDDLRRVHWPSSAKRDELMIRQLETPWQARGLVILDPRSSRYTGAASFEKAVRGAASVIHHLHDLGFDAQLWTGGPVISTREHEGYGRSMEALAVVERTDSIDLKAGAARLQRGGRGGALIVVTGSPDRDVLAIHQLLAHEFGKTVVMGVTDSGTAPGIIDFQRAGASAMVIAPDDSWAGAWLGALSRTTWSTASAG